MLMLGRNPEEYVVIGDDIVVKVVSVDGDFFSNYFHIKYRPF